MPGTTGERSTSGASSRRPSKQFLTSSLSCAPLSGTTTRPLRGGKGSHWEGGLRVPAFVASPLLPPIAHATHARMLMHVSDLHPTILAMAGSTEDLSHLDGHNMWGRIQQGPHPPRGPRNCSLSAWYRDIRNNSTAHVVCVDPAPSTHIYKLLVNPDMSAGWAPPPEMSARAITRSENKSKSKRDSESQSGRRAVQGALVKAWRREFLPNGVSTAERPPTELVAFHRRVMAEEYALYDLSVDEAERTDLAQTPIGAHTIAALRIVLEKSLQEAVEPCYGHQANCSATQFPEGPAWVPFL